MVILKLRDDGWFGMSEVAILLAMLSIFIPSCERRGKNLHSSPCGRIPSTVAQSRRVLLRYHMIAISQFRRGLKCYCKYVNYRAA